ncbi:MAG: NUDIX hydrolase [Janthinobacterium lividum]
MVAPVAAVIAVVALQSQVLLVRRANPPDQGLWGFPGGRVEAGETMFAAVERELLEETGIHARAERLVDAFDLLDHAPDGTLRAHFVLLVIACTWIDGTPTAGDDALDAAWFAMNALHDNDPRFSTRVAAIARKVLEAAP